MFACRGLAGVTFCKTDAGAVFEVPPCVFNLQAKNPVPYEVHTYTAVLHTAGSVAIHVPVRYDDTMVLSSPGQDPGIPSAEALLRFALVEAVCW